MLCFIALSLVFMFTLAFRPDPLAQLEGCPTPIKLPVANKRNRPVTPAAGVPLDGTNQNVAKTGQTEDVHLFSLLKK